MLRSRDDHRTLDIRISEQEEGTCLVQCSGSVDIASAPRFGEALVQAVRAASRRIVLDLRGVTFMDSVGIGQIVRARKELNGRVGLLIRTPDQRTRMLLDMAGLGGPPTPFGGGAAAA